MPTTHDAAAAALAAARNMAGVAVAIVRAESSSAATAIVGKTVFKDERPGEALRSAQRTQTRDYLLPASEYVVDGAAATPTLGDGVVEAGRTYRLVSVYGEPEWRWADPGQTWLRVHTVLADY